MPRNYGKRRRRRRKSEPSTSTTPQAAALTARFLLIRRRSETRSPGEVLGRDPDRTGRPPSARTRLVNDRRGGSAHRGRPRRRGRRPGQAADVRAGRAASRGAGGKPVAGRPRDRHPPRARWRRDLTRNRAGQEPSRLLRSCPCGVWPRRPCPNAPRSPAVREPWSAQLPPARC